MNFFYKPSLIKWRISKLLRIMRITTLLLLIGLMQTYATNSYSQNTKLSLKMENASIETILSKIEKISEFHFFFRSNEINSNDRHTIDANEQTIDEVLNSLLKDSKLTYKIFDKYIAIVSKENAKGNIESLFQQKSISGKVTDQSGVPLPGVSVVVKGTTTGVITDNNGNYSLANIPENATLQFSFVGMKTQEVAIAGKSSFNIIMEDETIGLEEVVAVGYGTQKKGNLTGSVASVNSDKLTISPIASTANSLAGRLPGLISVQSSGQPGNDAASLSIRGFDAALVIVDGIETSFNNIDANQIESVSILKDGSASIYGARAGNGVVLVTTKRGQNQKPTITLNSSTTFQGVTNMLKPANAGQRSEMEREGWLQSGQPESTAPFTAEAVQKYFKGTDPLYPNTDWYKEVMRNWAPQQQHNLSVRGGSDKIKYYGFIGYMDQETMIKKNGGDYNRYNLQSNIDAKITENLSLQLDLAAIVENKDYSARTMDGGNLWQDYWTTLPYYPANLPDPTKNSFAYGGGVGGLHLSSNRAISGYNDTNSENLKGTISLNYKIKAVKGLSAKAFLNYNKFNSFNKVFHRPQDFYTYDPTSQTYILAGSYYTKAALEQSYWKSSNMTQQYSLNYDNTFNNVHQITAMALYEAIDYKSDNMSASRIDFLTSAIDQMYAGSTGGMTNNGSATEMGRKSYLARINYRFKNKYLLETIIRADASAKFPSTKRWGFFPSVSFGWIISQEKFMKQFSKLDNLKLRASYGESGNDGVGNFQYLSGYSYGDTYLLGPDARQGLRSTGLANPNLTWERMNISNLGFDFSLSNRKLYGEADVFYRERSGIPATRITTLPSTFGAPLPPENINSLNDRGFELNIGTAGKIGLLTYDISGNISWSRSKWDHYEEPVYTDKDQKRIYKASGGWTNRNWGYLSDGLFTSQAEIDGLKFDQDQKENKSLSPGDIRYIDVNNDKILNWKDQVEIGKGSVPHWMVGFSTNFKYENFDFTALFQGAFGYNTVVNKNPYNQPQYSTLMYEERWTTTNNNPNAMFPRLGGSSTNNLFSDYYLKKAGYIRLKTASLGYSLPKQWLNTIGINQVRIFTSGTNLLTFNKLNSFGLDPEAPGVGNYYPQQRTISFGVNLSF